MLYTKIGFGLLLALAFTVSGCTFSQKDSVGLAAQEKNLRQPQTQTLSQRYRIIVVEPVAIPVEMSKQYPQTARSCQSSAISALKAKEAFTLVHHTAPKDPASPVLLVRSKITDMRLTSKISRLWAGSTAASSYMNMDVQLVDADSKKILHLKQLSTISAVPAPSPTAAGPT